MVVGAAVGEGAGELIAKLLLSGVVELKCVMWNVCCWTGEREWGIVRACRVGLCGVQSRNWKREKDKNEESDIYNHLPCSCGVPLVLLQGKEAGTHDERN